MEDRAELDANSRYERKGDERNNTKGIKDGKRAVFPFTSFPCDGNTRCFLRDERVKLTA